MISIFVQQAIYQRSFLAMRWHNNSFQRTDRLGVFFDIDAIYSFIAFTNGLVPCLSLNSALQISAIDGNNLIAQIFRFQKMSDDFYPVLRMP
jgi:hypothetical protein